MDKVLLPNPDGCTEFARHQFKKDRCKNCGKRWQEHLGVISDELVTEFLLAQKSAEDRRHREEEEAKMKAKAKARAKRKLKKKQERADDWFFSGGEGTTTSEDDAVGFQMMQGGDSGLMLAPTVNHGRRKSTDKGQQPRVVNLIDFTECDIPDDPALGIVDNPATSSSADPLMTPAVMRVPVSGPGAGLTVLSEEGVTILAEEQLLAEIEHLRQRLRDADAERSVQISIVRDEVEEKQRIIEELEQKRRDAETSLQEALAQVEALRQERDAAATAAAAAEEVARAREAAAAAEAAQRGPSPQALEEEEVGAEAVLGRQGFAAAFGCAAAGLDPAELEVGAGAVLGREGFAAAFGRMAAGLAPSELEAAAEEKADREEDSESDVTISVAAADPDDTEEVSEQPRVQEPAEDAGAEVAEAKAAGAEAAEAAVADAEAAEAAVADAEAAEAEAADAETAEAEAADAEDAEAEAADAEAAGEEIHAAKPQGGEPDLQMEPQEKGLLLKFLEQQLFKCLRPNTLD